jgi:hypothetical protein
MKWAVHWLSRGSSYLDISLEWFDEVMNTSLPPYYNLFLIIPIRIGVVLFVQISTDVADVLPKLNVYFLYQE